MRAVDEVRIADVLIVGTGVAGLAAALGCAGRRVTVLTKSRFGEGGSSTWAQGGVAVAVGADDSPALHAADTLAVAGGLADRRMVELLTAEGPRRIAELVRLGAAFDRAASGAADRGGDALPAALSDLALGQEAAHSRRRILHAGGDATGRELVRALAEAVRRAPGVRVEEESFAVDLVVEPAARGLVTRRGARVAGVLALDRDGRRVLHLAAATVLATGGAGQLFLHTTNPPEVTADGLAMAARAGARLADLELVQFHPTALAVDGPRGAARLPLLTEALRGEGAVLVDGHGHRFMPDEHPAAELAPRDVVARAIHRRLAAGDRVFLDARRAIGDRFPERFPTVFAAAREAGLDPRTEPLPVVPAAHYHMGGVVTDERGRTSLPGLWACGETATTGVHGANRLASNSLLEALVFGARVADDLARRLAAVPGATAADLARLRVAGEGVLTAGPAATGPDDLGDLAGRAAALRHRLRVRMAADVGLVRDAAGMARAAEELRWLETEAAELLRDAEDRAGAAAAGGVLRDLLETRNLLTAGTLVTAAARVRRESRGAHYRSDFPHEDAGWRRRVLVTARTGAEPLLMLSAPLADARPTEAAAAGEGGTAALGVSAPAAAAAEPGSRWRGSGATAGPLPFAPAASGAATPAAGPPPPRPADRFGLAAPRIPVAQANGVEEPPPGRRAACRPPLAEGLR
ncbi:MAG TPA: L-aspartate oxidase [Thermoanaerobaculia bacterium]